MKQLIYLSLIVCGMTGLTGCGGGGEEPGDNNIVAASLALTDGVGRPIGLIPATGTPAGVVTARITLKPGLDVNPATVKMTVVRDDFYAVGGSPVVMDRNPTTGEYSGAVAIPDNTLTSLRNYKVSITARNSAGRPVPFISQIGTFQQAEP